MITSRPSLQPSRPARRGALLLVATIALTLPAGWQAFGQKPVKPRPPFQVPYDSITAVDAAKGTISVGHVNSTDKSVKNYTFSRTCEFEVNGNKGTAADLKPGMKVSVNAGMDAGVADRVSAGPTPVPATPVPTPSKPKTPGKKY